jgi:hypothetical protein
MKKIIITLAVAISSLTAFAGEENVSSSVLKAFNKEFAGVKEVKWTTAENYYKAEFVFNGQNVTAFYQVDGEMMALTRNISSLELPISLQTNLKNNYSGYWISDLFEMSNSEGTSYYITMENADSKVVLKSVGSGKWTSFKKMSKI